VCVWERVRAKLCEVLATRVNSSSERDLRYVLYFCFIGLSEAACARVCVCVLTHCCPSASASRCWLIYILTPLRLEARPGATPVAKV
jgi:hypothetical protein